MGPNPHPNPKTLLRQVILIQEYLGIVMEYCPGGTLADFMAARLCTGPDGGLPEKTARCTPLAQILGEAWPAAAPERPAMLRMRKTVCA